LSENKQHTPEFENCIQEVVKQGHEKGSAFAICTDSFQRAGKPIFVGESETQKLHLFCESFRLEGNKVSGVAIHPKRIFHPEEGLTHVYLREELENASPTLVGKPFGIDHLYILPPPNVITEAWYCNKENGVAFKGLVDDNIAEQIRNNAFKGLSIELNWLKPGGKIEYVNGVAARNFDLTSVHFLKRFPPGDREAYIRLWEQLTLKEAEWTTEYVNNLADSAFAAIEPGGEKDAEGKTTPRSLRHLEHHNVEGNVDEAHVKAALQRLDQTKISAELKSEAKRHLCGHAKQMAFVSEVCGEEPPRVSESVDVVSLRKKIVDLEAKLAESEKTLRKQTDVIPVEKVEAIMPPLQAERSFSYGPQRLIQDLKKLIREAKEVKP